ncbi:DinB family protein [Brevibacillus ruminantium]|uniref:DinB family protein n=1 Tax=Brevibacillus ruminantium TaxID=2950604 RepID=A0ABY4WH78_9BACL|nr:DinB family protein [Brevibacillus ruminantium]USG65498.1 DinB family protein [Brevibacillus ruminantium]
MLSKEVLISQFAGVRKRTLKYLQEMPADMMDWRPAPDKFSCGDIIRHLGSTERMFYHAITENEWKYTGHGPEKGETLEAALHYLQDCHEAVLTGLQQLEPEQFNKKVKNLLGYEVSAWRIVMAMIEHEIHHRGQLSAYMQTNQVQPPQIFGLQIEQIPTALPDDQNRDE